MMKYSTKLSTIDFDGIVLLGARFFQKLGNIIAKKYTMEKSRFNGIIKGFVLEYAHKHMLYI